MGTTCGRREREADAGNEEEQFSRVLVVATVEGTPIHGMPVAFAGGRKSVGLGRSVMSAAGLVPMQAVAPTTTGVLWNKEEGNVVSVRQAHALVAVDAEQAPPRMRTRPSLSPETRARLSPLNSQRESVATVVRSVRYRGRANLRKQEEPAPGSGGSDAARLAARHRFTGQLVEVVRDASEKEGGHGHRPCEETGAPVGVRTSQVVAEVGRQDPGPE
jgi:hypothetical protein